MTMLKVLEQYDIDKVIARAKEPWAIIRAMVSYDDRDKAKAVRFNWEDCGHSIKFPKCWVKKVKVSDIGFEQQRVDFEIKRIV